MFGFLRPDLTELGKAERLAYASTYCNLCGHLRGKYDVKSRWLVVHDLACLSWLINDCIEFPLLRLNCVRGGARRAVGTTGPWSFLASMSALAVGIKLEDDREDGGGRVSRALSRWFGNTVARAEANLDTNGFPLNSLRQSLQSHRAVEARGEANLDQAASATGQCYGMAAAHLAELSEERLPVEDARVVGDGLGRAVYVLDAMRDFRLDRKSEQYNPLCLQADPDIMELPDKLREEAVTYIASCLNPAREIFASNQSRQRMWHAVTRTIARLAAGPKQSVVLQSTICVPCGDGVVVGNSEDCCQSACGLACCLFCCVSCGCPCDCPCS